MTEPAIHSSLDDALPSDHPLAFEQVHCARCRKLVHAANNECMRTWVECPWGLCVCWECANAMWPGGAFHNGPNADATPPPPAIPQAILTLVVEAKLACTRRNEADLGNGPYNGEQSARLRTATEECIRACAVAEQALLRWWHALWSEPTE